VKRPLKPTSGLTREQILVKLDALTPAERAANRAANDAADQEVWSWWVANRTVDPGVLTATVELVDRSASFPVRFMRRLLSTVADQVLGLAVVLFVAVHGEVSHLWAEVSCMEERLRKLVARLDPRAIGSARRRKRGRPTEYDPGKDAQIVEAWRTGRFLNYQALADALGLTRSDVERAIKRDRGRGRRRNNSPE
jgi:hypothetical protein